MNVFQSMHDHFERVAPVYADVRNDDPDFIEAIILRLRDRSQPLNIADIGCGTGRYSHIIAKKLRANMKIFCCDYSLAMLNQCRNRMRLELSSRFVYCCCANANELPFGDSYFDAVFSFNSVHHFNLARFVAQASRILCPGGLLAIYTRTREQNTRTIWGQHFPGFAERETRLYQCEEIQEAIYATLSLELENIQTFTYEREESLKSLLNRVRNFHYSTFALYSQDELADAIDIFVKKLTKLHKNGTIKHTAENTLVLAQRQ